MIDLIDEPDKDDLHIAGRLDFNTTGLMLLTNDGQWSRRLTQPTSLQGKVYLVETEDEIPAASRLRPRPVLVRGLVRPAESRRCMFGHFGNKVTALHREHGPTVLDASLTPGCYRPLTDNEIALDRP